MKTSIAILATASILSITSAAPSPAAVAVAKPEGYATVYQTPGCTETEVLESQGYELTEGKCINLDPSSLSFQGGTTGLNACPKGTNPTVSVFEGTDCTLAAVATPKLDPTGIPSTCEQTVFVPDVTAGQGLKLVGKAVRFNCVAAK